MIVNLYLLPGSRKELKKAKKEMTTQFCELKMFSKIKCFSYLELNVLEDAEFEMQEKLQGRV